MSQVSQARVEAILLTQPAGLFQLMLRMSEHLRAEVRELFPDLTLAEHMAVCDMVTMMMQESMEKVRLATGRTCHDYP